MIRRAVFIAILTIILVLLQLSFWPNLGSFFSLLNLPVIFLINLSFFGFFDRSFLAAFISGFILDLYSVKSFSFYLIIYVIFAFFGIFAMLKTFSHSARLNYYFFSFVSLLFFYFLHYVSSLFFGGARFYSWREFLSFVAVNFICFIILSWLFKRLINKFLLKNEIGR